MVVVTILVTAGGCFWREYGGRAGLHARVLVSTARKGADLLRSDRFRPENLPELYYPLTRARAFAVRAERRSGTDPPASLGEFLALLDAYAAFYAVADDVRRDARPPAARRALREALWAVRRRAIEVERALAAEGRV